MRFEFINDGVEDMDEDDIYIKVVANINQRIKRPKFIEE